MELDYLLITVAALNKEMRGGLHGDGPRVEPATLHGLAPVEEHGEGQQRQQGKNGNEEPLLHTALREQQGSVNVGRLLVLVVRLHIDIGQPCGLLVVKALLLLRRVRTITQGCPRRRHLTLGKQRVGLLRQITNTGHARFETCVVWDDLLCLGRPLREPMSGPFRAQSLPLFASRCKPKTI